MVTLALVWEWTLGSRSGAQAEAAVVGRCAGRGLHWAVQASAGAVAELETDFGVCRQKFGRGKIEAETRRNEIKGYLRGGEARERKEVSGSWRVSQGQLAISPVAFVRGQGSRVKAGGLVRGQGSLVSSPGFIIDWPSDSG